MIHIFVGRTSHPNVHIWYSMGVDSYIFMTKFCSLIYILGPRSSYHYYFFKLAEIESAVRLAKAGLLTSIDYMNLLNIDVSKVEEIEHLVHIVETRIYLNGVTGKY